MQVSYTKNFLKIYFWRGLSILFNMVSMLIVIPALTSEPTVYGVYMLCISLNIFLNYADIGFIDAGSKYAAEYYGRGDLKNEKNVVGFVIFILILFLTIPVTIFFIASLKPDILITGLTNLAEVSIASQLLLIQALFTFNIIFEKLGGLMYGIRLENHKINQITIIAYAIKISSIFYFFSDDKYDIVGYFLFGKITETIAYIIIVNLGIVRFKYGYDFFLQKIKFSKVIYNKTKGIAFVSFLGTIMWIVYYELDSVIIAKYLGVEILAFFAIGLALTKFIRSFFSIIFTPFSARFNHLKGQNEMIKLNIFFTNSLKIVFPFLFIVVLSIIALSKPLILSWVGPDYTLSITIFVFLALAMLTAPIRSMATAIATTLEKIKLLYIINIGMAIGYWTIILLTVDKFGVLSFPYAKFFVFIVADFLFLYKTCQIMSINYYKLLFSLFQSIIAPSLFIGFFSYIYLTHFVFEKSKQDVLFVIGSVAILIVLSFLISMISKDLRNLLKMQYKQLFIKQKFT